MIYSCPEALEDQKIVARDYGEAEEILDCEHCRGLQREFHTRECSGPIEEGEE